MMYFWYVLSIIFKVKKKIKIKNKIKGIKRYKANRMLDEVEYLKDVSEIIIKVKLIKIYIFLICYNFCQIFLK